MADKHFEQEVHDRMEEFKLSPSEPVWKNIEAQLRKDKRRRWFFFLLFTGALIGIGSVAYYQINNNPSTELSKITQQTIDPQIPPITQSKENNKTVEKASATDSNNDQPSPVNANPNAAPISLVQKKEAITQKQSVVVEEKIPAPVIAIQKKSTTVNNTAPTEVNREESIETTGSSSLEMNKTNEAISIVKKEVDAVMKQTPQNIDTNTAEQIKVSSTEAKSDTTTVVQKEPVKKQINPKKKKWEIGLQFNSGITTLKDQLFATNKVTVNDSYPIQLISGNPGPSFSAVVVNAYKISSNLQIGAGIILRKPLRKNSLFVTGVNYQYQSFNVESNRRVDSYSQQQGRFTTISQDQTKSSFLFHYLNIPTEIQWNLLTAKNRSVGLSTGIQHSLRIAGSNEVPSFTNGNKATVYQPIISLIPTYEWIGNSRMMQLGLYFNYGLSPVYKNSTGNHWWQTGLRFQYFFKPKK